MEAMDLAEALNTALSENARNQQTIQIAKDGLQMAKILVEIRDRLKSQEIAIEIPALTSVILYAEMFIVNYGYYDPGEEEPT